MSTKEKVLALAGVVAIGSIALTGCTQAGAEPKPSHSHSTETPKPEYQKTPTADELAKLYMPANATDEQLAQNAVNITNLMYSGSNQGNDGLLTVKAENELGNSKDANGNKIGGKAASDQLAMEWTDAIFHDPNLFNQQANVEGQASFWTNSVQGDYEAGGGTITFTYDSYQPNPNHTPHDLLVDFTFNEPTAAGNGAGSQIKNGQKGVFEVVYAPSADGTKMVIQDLVMQNVNVQQ